MGAERLSENTRKRQCVSLPDPGSTDRLGYGLHNPGFQSRDIQEIFLLSKLYRPSLGGQTSYLYIAYRG